ncbi:copper(I)-binding protein [Natronospira proteinivora]|uniref:Copper(I)-binding protein n=1 Tax=Natronospira proteinivora TaxID=1807133 RepID=A0ABT1G7B3_9GAMM|nr:copper chaperone PCu(A)C [Natronospira proteinivora]MCP1727111.1 copper(I)-binding protein [Natronospira proteinivora]
MNRVMHSALLLLCLLAPSAWAAPQVLVEDPWVREAPPGTSVTAAYMTLTNQGEEAVELVSVSAREFARAELHETVHENDSASMQAIESLSIPAEGQVALEPGGKHLMLHEPRDELAAGDWVTLMLTFDDGHLLEVTAPIKRRTGQDEDQDEGEGEGEGEHHHHGGHH